MSQRYEVGATRLYVDRVFTLHGIGTVATGTLWSGSIGEGDVVRAEPAGADVRVRSVQVHDRAVERAEAGQRVAVALPGVRRDALRRGDALVAPGGYPSSYRLDVALDEVAPIRDGARATVHHGTAAIPSRVVRAGARWAQLRLSQPVVAARGDRVVLRAATTLGGGLVLDPAPPRHADERRFELVERGDVAALVHEPVPLGRVRHLGGPDGLQRAGDWVFSPAWLDELRRALLARLDAADPLDPGIPPPSEPWAADVVPLLGLERRGAKLYLPGSTASLGAREAEAAALARAVEEAGFSPLKVEDAALAAHLERDGALVRLGDGLVIGRGAYERARDALLDECERAGSITLARFRDLLGISRRPAQLLLERFDVDGLTRRVGDERVLRRAARARP